MSETTFVNTRLNIHQGPQLRSVHDEKRGEWFVEVVNRLPGFLRSSSAMTETTFVNTRIHVDQLLIADTKRPERVCGGSFSIE